MIVIFSLPGLVFPDSTREHGMPARADQLLLGRHWRSLHFLATYTSCYLKLLKDLRPGWGQDEHLNLHVFLTSFFAVVEI